MISIQNNNSFIHKTETEGVKKNETQGQKSPWKKVMYLAVGILGLMTTGYIIYSSPLFMTNHPHTLDYPKVPSPQDHNDVVHSLLSSSLDSTQTAIPLCKRVDLWPEYESGIANTINSCSATRKIGELANFISSSNNRLPWRIKIVPVGSQFAEGAAAYFQGEVRIECDTEEATSIAVFELTNFGHQNHLDKLWRNALWGKVSRDKYAEIAEEIEFNGTQIHHTTMAECIQELGWEPAVLRWGKMTWENYWPHASIGAHAEWHRKQWDIAADWYNHPIRRPIIKIYEVFQSFFGSTDKSEL